MDADNQLLIKFCELLEAYVAYDATPHTEAKLYELTGKLWNSTDRLPRAYHDDLEAFVHQLDFDQWKRAGSTYGIAARLVRQHLKAERTKAAA